MTSYRDIRDPQKLGEALLEQAPLVRQTYGESITLTEVYDYHVGKFDIPDHQGSTLGEITAQEYLDELQSRTDRYAASTLEAIRLGKKPPIDPYGD